MVKNILFVTVSLWAGFVTFCLFVYNPLPFPDNGHRAFAVRDETAAKVVVKILSDFGLSEKFTFDAGPTHQTLLADNMTVIIRHDAGSSLAPNGLSLAVKDPDKSAREVAKSLTDAGFLATVIPLPGMEKKLVVLTSTAFHGWSMVFRRHILAMGSPPNKRRLIEK